SPSLLQIHTYDVAFRLADVLNLMDDRLAPANQTGLSEIFLRLSAALGTACMEIRKIHHDAPAMLMPPFRFPWRNTNLQNPDKLILEHEFVGVGGYFQRIEILLNSIGPAPRDRQQRENSKSDCRFFHRNISLYRVLSSSAWFLPSLSPRAARCKIKPGEKQKAEGSGRRERSHSAFRLLLSAFWAKRRVRFHDRCSVK